MNRNLYLGLKEIAKAIVGTDTKPVFKYIGMWNNQVENTKDGKIFDYRKPAMFFEFVPSQVGSVGAGRQVFDPLAIRIHVIDELFDAKDGTNEVNLRVFDLGDTVYTNFQLNSVKDEAKQYGTSPLDRTGIELDTDHDNLYHHTTEFTTTWTDNLIQQPVGGYEIDPVLLAQLTSVVVNPTYGPSLNVTPTVLAFGNVTVGQNKILSFTIDGAGLEDDVILSTSLGIFTISLTTNYSSRIVLSPELDKTLLSTNVNVKFSPLATGAFTGHINYGVPGLNLEIALTGNGS